MKGFHREYLRLATDQGTCDQPPLVVPVVVRVTWLRNPGAVIPTSVSASSRVQQSTLCQSKSTRRDAHARQTRGALTFRELMLSKNRKAPAVAMRRLSFEASYVQTNTRDQESRANSNRTIPLYGDSPERTKRALPPAQMICCRSLVMLSSACA